MFKYSVLAINVFLLLSCSCSMDRGANKPNSTVLISAPAEQRSVFNNLVNLTGNYIPANQLNDSLAFLVLPVELSCPACRRKAIDSIVAHQHNLPDRHYIIISGSEGRRNMKAYFKEVDKEMPEMEDRLFLDTTNMAYKMKLVSENPAFYYACRQNAYRKVLAVPATVKDDLCEFFSGACNVNHK